MKFDFEEWAEDAKPCPFCGSKDIYTEKSDHFYDGNMSCTYVECKDCGAQIYGEPMRGKDGKYELTYEAARNHAMNAWNRRVTS